MEAFVLKLEQFFILIFFDYSRAVLSWQERKTQNLFEKSNFGMFITLQQAPAEQRGFLLKLHLPYMVLMLIANFFSLSSISTLTGNNNKVNIPVDLEVCMYLYISTLAY
jgi:hypothetical protein